MDFDSGDLEEEVIAEPEDVNPPSYFITGLIFLQANGWYILIVSLLLYYLWRSKISDYVERWRKRRDEEEEMTKYKKDPDLYKAREEARMAAVLRMQNHYNEQAARMKLIAEEREKKKREALISKNAHLFGGRKLNDPTPSTENGRENHRIQRENFPSYPSDNR